MQVRGGIARLQIWEFREGSSKFRQDEIVIEEPLEIRIVTKNEHFPVAVTMRTPGSDFELALGFLFCEGIIKERNQIQYMEYCSKPQNFNVLNIYLKSDTSFDSKLFSRHIFTSSSCGICGKTTIEAVKAIKPQKPIGNDVFVPDFFYGLITCAFAQQNIFKRTGGLHASFLFNNKGEILLTREDIGRHNAMDKVVGSLLKENLLPASNKVVLFSGRLGFELVQKAAIAGIPVVVSFGAPSNLAIDFAHSYQMTLIGFLSKKRFNVYSGKERIKIN